MSNFEINEQDLQRLETDLNAIEPALREAQINSIEELRDLWTIEAIRDDIIDSGDYLASIAANRVDATKFVLTDVNDIFLDSDVGYSGFIEFGKKNQTHTKREPLGKALEEFDRREILDHAIREQLGKILEKG